MAIEVQSRLIRSHGDVDFAKNRCMRVNGINLFLLTASGAPATGSYQKGDMGINFVDFKLYMCTTAGTPGTWKASAAFT